MTETLTPDAVKALIASWSDPKVLRLAIAYLALVEENERLRKRVEAADALLKRAEEELRLIRMKDTGAVYDILLRTDFAAYRATDGQSHE